MFYLFIFPVILLNSLISFKGLLWLLLTFLFCVFRFLSMLYVDHQFSSVQSLSRVRLCNPMNHSTSGLPVHHQLPESTQTHVY